MKKVTVFIIGDTKNEHVTIVQYDDQYYYFWSDMYEGISYKEVIDYLKFLSFEVFEVYKTRGTTPVVPINYNYQVYI